MIVFTFEFYRLGDHYCGRCKNDQPALNLHVIVRFIFFLWRENVDTYDELRKTYPSREFHYSNISKVLNC